MIKRLKLLLKNHVISIKIFSVCKNVFLELKNWDQNDKERFLTHLAMALNRIEKGEKTDSLSNEIINTLKSNSLIIDAENYLKKILKSFPNKIPKNEKWFLIMHIMNHLERRKK